MIDTIAIIAIVVGFIAFVLNAIFWIEGCRKGNIPQWNIFCCGLSFGITIMCILQAILL